ncbi:hypothetical protein K440DRAFT_581684, partial [Wilcoxina mikolae CBS 423.85]
MPIHRLTLARNSNRNTRTILLLNTTTTTNPLATILTTARTKLRARIKTARLFLLPTGHELDVTDNPSLLSALASTPDATLLISEGEDFVGVASPIPTVGGVVKNLAKNTYTDPQAIQQLNSSAALQGITMAVGQPDLHPGTKFPIGAVFVSKEWLHPPLIGSDIGCGMSYYRVSLPRTSLEGKVACQRVAETLRGLEGPWLGAKERNAWLGGEENATGIEKFDQALGTIGAGNHFAEVQTVEEGVEIAGGEVVLLVHSGSRGFGGEVLGRFYSHDTEEEGKSGRINVVEEPERAKEYLELHDKACNWAHANRDLIALRFLQRLEPGGEWDCAEEYAPEDIKLLRGKVVERKWVDIHHNNVVKSLWPPRADDGEEEQTEVYIHRKGAAPTTPSHPLLPLPGSRGTPTLLLKPLFNPENGYGRNHALSAAHGAGRAMSRAKAGEKFKGRYEEAGGGKKNGGWLVCDEKELVWEEAPDAYKDVETVAKDLVD